MCLPRVLAHILEKRASDKTYKICLVNGAKGERVERAPAHPLKRACQHTLGV